MHHGFLYISWPSLHNYNVNFLIAHFTVTGANEAGVDLVLIRPFLLYYVNHVVVVLTIIFLAKFP